MRTRRLGAILLAGALSAGLAACGDDGGDDEGTALEDVGGGDGEETTTTESSGGDDTGTTDLEDLEDVLTGECAFMVEAAAAFGAAFTGAGDQSFDDVAAGFGELADEAPDELRDDIEVLAEAFQEFADLIGDVDLSDPNAFQDPEVQAAFAEAGEIFDSPEVTEANENFTAFVEENCPAAG